MSYYNREKPQLMRKEKNGDFSRLIVGINILPKFNAMLVREWIINIFQSNHRIILHI